MIDARPAAQESVDVGEYCRRVEEHLARANEGQLVRIAGVGFALVRGWAEMGVPLSVVCRGIDQKVERHRAGRSRRPLRIEFCEGDVRAVFHEWQRAVGVMSTAIAPDEAPREDARRPSLARHVDRAIAMLTRAAGRLETPESLREHLTETLSQVVAGQEETRGARGAAREAFAARLAQWDAALVAAARAAVSAGDLHDLRGEAETELASYRARLSAEAWARSVDAAVDRLLRDRFGLPLLEP